MSEKEDRVLSTSPYDVEAVVPVVVEDGDELESWLSSHVKFSATTESLGSCEVRHITCICNNKNDHQEKMVCPPVVVRTVPPIGLVGSRDPVR